MSFENSSSLCRLRRKRPIAVIKSASQNNSIAARKHIAAGQITIVNLRLRQEDFQLAAYWFQLFIAKDRFRAEARAVENDSLRQSLDLFAAVKFFDHQLTARDVKISQEGIEIHWRLDQHGVVLSYVIEAKIMVRIAVNFLRRIQVIAPG